ncbi:MAG: hypothetical protein ACRETW_01220 [Stenotrophobium sp.]
MKAPQDKALGYTAVVIVAAIVIFIGAVAGLVMPHPGIDFSGLSK